MFDLNIAYNRTPAGLDLKDIYHLDWEDDPRSFALYQLLLNPNANYGNGWEEEDLWIEWALIIGVFQGCCYSPPIANDLIELSGRFLYLFHSNLSMAFSKFKDFKSMHKETFNQLVDEALRLLHAASIDSVWIQRYVGRNFVKPAQTNPIFVQNNVSVSVNNVNVVLNREALEPSTIVQSSLSVDGNIYPADAPEWQTNPVDPTSFTPITCPVGPSNAAHEVIDLDQYEPSLGHRSGSYPPEIPDTPVNNAKRPKQQQGEWKWQAYIPRSSRKISKLAGNMITSKFKIQIDQPNSQ